MMFNATFDRYDLKKYPYLTREVRVTDNMVQALVVIVGVGVEGHGRSTFATTRQLLIAGCSNSNSLQTRT